MVLWVKVGTEVDPSGGISYGRDFVNWRGWVIEIPDKWCTWRGTELGPLCSGPVAYEIPEGYHWKQICQRDRQNRCLGESYTVTPVVGVRLQVHK